MTDQLTPTLLVFLGLAALAAGWIDAVVGGGGLVQLPALLIGIPSATPAPAATPGATPTTPPTLRFVPPIGQPQPTPQPAPTVRRR